MYRSATPPVTKSSMLGIGEEVGNSSVRKRMLSKALERSCRGSIGNEVDANQMMMGRTSQFDEIRSDLEQAFDELGRPMPQDVHVVPLMQAPVECQDCKEHVTSLRDLQHSLDALQVKYDDLQAQRQTEKDAAANTIAELQQELDALRTAPKTEITSPVKNPLHESNGVNKVYSILDVLELDQDPENFSPIGKRTQSPNLDTLVASKATSISGLDNALITELIELRNRVARVETRLDERHL